MATRKRKREDIQSCTAKKPNGAESNLKSSTDEAQFFAGFAMFIFPPGIQKARLQLFKSLVEKHGGSLKETLASEVTHIIVDDTMTAERMCKILKLETPPADKAILKTAWLSSCFREKNVVNSADFVVQIPASVEKKSTVTKDISTLENQEDEPKVQEDTEKELSPTTSEHKFPKVGVMWNAFKSKPKGDDSEDADSDYVPSDNEDSGIGHAAASTSSTDTTPNTTPEKKVPVSVCVCVCVCVPHDFVSCPISQVVLRWSIIIFSFLMFIPRMTFDKTCVFQILCSLNKLALKLQNILLTLYCLAT